MERASERTKAQSVGPTTVCQRRRAATHTDMQGRSQPQGPRRTSCHDHSDPRDFRKSDVKLQKQKVDYLAIATASCSSRGEKKCLALFRIRNSRLRRCGHGQGRPSVRGRGLLQSINWTLSILAGRQAPSPARRRMIYHRQSIGRSVGQA